MLQIGQSAPHFEVTTDDGEKLTPTALAGKPYVLFFYPQDNTPTCTTEAVSFSSIAGDFAASGVKIIGVSPDSAKSHLKFRGKHDLSVALASDESLQTIKAFGLWGEKTTFGRTNMGVERATFLIGADGVIEGIWRQVRVKGHAEEVLAAAEALKRTSGAWAD